MCGLGGVVKGLPLGELGAGGLWWPGVAPRTGMTSGRLLSAGEMVRPGPSGSGRPYCGRKLPVILGVVLCGMVESRGGEFELDFASAADEAYGLTLEYVRMMQQAAWMCLHQGPHPQPVSFGFDCEGGELAPEVVALTWTTPNAEILRTYADLQEATEWGAAGIALLLLHHAFGFRRYQRSWKGTGFDFWASKDMEGELMDGCDHLEVSGLLNGDVRREQERVAQKLGQVGRGGMPGNQIVAVINFGPPKARFVFRAAGETS